MSITSSVRTSMTSHAAGGGLNKNFATRQSERSRRRRSSIEPCQSRAEHHLLHIGFGDRPFPRSYGGGSGHSKGPDSGNRKPYGPDSGGCVRTSRTEPVTDLGYVEVLGG